MKLNHAVAIAMARGPASALPLIDALDAAGSLAGYPPLPAARADLLSRLGRTREAAAEYRRALALSRSDPERHHLAQRCTAMK